MLLLKNTWKYRYFSWSTVLLYSHLDVKIVTSTCEAARRNLRGSSAVSANASWSLHFALVRARALFWCEGRKQKGYGSALRFLQNGQVMLQPFYLRMCERAQSLNQNQNRFSICANEAVPAVRNQSGCLDKCSMLEAAAAACFHHWARYCDSQLLWWRVGLESTLFCQQQLMSVCVEALRVTECRSENRSSWRS